MIISLDLLYAKIIENKVRLVNIIEKSFHNLCSLKRIFVDYLLFLISCLRASVRLHVRLYHLFLVHCDPGRDPEATCANQGTQFSNIWCYFPISLVRHLQFILSELNNKFRLRLTEIRDFV
jgi:hypothetical protein